MYTILYMEYFTYFAKPGNAVSERKLHQIYFP